MPRSRDAELLRAVGQRVAEARRDRGVTQESLAERVGIAPVSLSRLETGDRALSLSTLGKLSEALQVPLGDLLDHTRDLPAPDAARPAHAELCRLHDDLTPQRQSLLLALARELASD